MARPSVAVRNYRYAVKARLRGSRHSLRVIREARAAGVPISWAFAMIEQESGFRNVFGCDRGSILCHQKVTRARVKQLIRHVQNGGVSNGVGLTQLTSLGYILRAEKLGGAHIPRNQIRVGMQVLREKTGGDMSRAWRYNGDPSYQSQIARKQRAWHSWLT